MVKNIISSFFTRALVAMLNLGILLLISKQLGSQIVGQISILILNIAIVQIIVEIYTGSTLVYFIPKYNTSKIYKHGLMWLILTTTFCNSIFYFFNIGESNLAWHVFILSALMSLNAFHLILLLGKERIKSYNFLTLLQPLLLFFSLVYSIYFQDQISFEAYLFAIYFAIGLTLVCSTVALIVSINKNNLTKSDFNFGQTIANGFMNQIANLSHTLSNRLNYYLLGTSALVGVYASSSSLVESLWIISASISPLLLTHIANQRDALKQGRLTLLLSKLCFLLSLVGIIVLYLLPVEFFLYLLGKDFVQTKTVMLYLSPGVLCISFSSIVSHYFSGQGLQKIQLSANLSGLVVTVITAWFFIQQFGILGACLAASCSYATQAIVLLVVFMKHNRFNLTALFTFSKDLGLLKR